MLDGMDWTEVAQNGLDGLALWAGSNPERVVETANKAREAVNTEVDKGWERDRDAEVFSIVSSAAGLGGGFFVAPGC